jgi:hypothetical protein
MRLSQECPHPARSKAKMRDLLKDPATSAGCDLGKPIKKQAFGMTGRKKY